MSEQRERYIVTDAQLTTVAVPASGTDREQAGYVVKPQGTAIPGLTESMSDMAGRLWQEVDHLTDELGDAQREVERLRAELRRLRVLALWLRGDLAVAEARCLLGLSEGTVHSVLLPVLAEARKALGLEECDG